MLRHLNRAEEYLAVAILVAMTCLVFSQVVLRFLFGLGFGWIDELARIAFIWVVFLGAVVGIQRHLHIRVSLFIRLLPAGCQAWVSGLGDIVVFLLCAAMVWHGLELVLSTLQFSFVLPSTGLSMFWPYLILPLSFALQIVRLGLRYALRDRSTHHV